MRVTHATPASGTNNPAKQISVTRWNEDHAIIALTAAQAAALSPAVGQIVLIEEEAEPFECVLSSDHAAGVAADSVGAIYKATADATKVLIRRWSGRVEAKWWGWAESNAAADNDAAMSAMWTTLAALKFNTSGASAGFWDVDLGPGSYATSSPIAPTGGSVNIYGRGMGHGTTSAPAGATRILPQGCHGFAFLSGTASASSTVNDLCVQGDFIMTEADYHGVYATTKLTCRNVNVRNMRGDGFYFLGETANGTNCNNWRLEGCEALANRSGVHPKGNNANAGEMIGGRVTQNREAGIKEESTLGNKYSCSIGTNGVEAANDGVTIGAAEVSDGINRFGVIAGQEVTASTTAPPSTATDDANYYFIAAGGAASGVPLWTSGMTLRAGGGVLATVSGARNCFQCYGENGGPKAQITGRSLVLSGYLSSWCFQNTGANLATSIVRGGATGAVAMEPSLEVTGGTVKTQLTATMGNSNNVAIRYTETTASPNGHGLIFTTSDGNLLHTYNNSANVSTYQFLITGPSTTTQLGTGAAVSHAMFVPRLALPSSFGGTIGTGRQVCRAATVAAPSGGATVDTECRAQLSAALTALKNAGLMST